MDTPVHRGWLYRRFLPPILALLRTGATPEALAWSIAVGLALGINPLVGTSTILCLAAALLFRLNLAAAQLANYAAYPLQLLLIVPFIALGSRIFHTAPLPLSPSEFLAQARQSPLSLVRQLWLWEWHAMIVWAAIAAVFIPLLRLALTPILRGLTLRMSRRQPITVAD
ncbi:MAG TPA: DUF2062 domain-containing protein [Granulicella sp.]